MLQPCSILFLTFVLSGVNVSASSSSYHGYESSLVARAAAKVEYVCRWNDLIAGTTVKPIVLVVGLTIGGIAGIVIATMLFYLSGKASKGGARPGGGGGQMM